jgi:hypothetical protein
VCGEELFHAEERGETEGAEVERVTEALQRLDDVIFI